MERKAEYTRSETLGSFENGNIAQLSLRLTPGDNGQIIGSLNILKRIRFSDSWGAPPPQKTDAPKDAWKEQYKESDWGSDWDDDVWGDDPWRTSPGDFQNVHADLLCEKSVPSVQ